MSSMGRTQETLFVDVQQWLVLRCARLEYTNPTFMLLNTTSMKTMLENFFIREGGAGGGGGQVFFRALPKIMPFS